MNRDPKTLKLYIAVLDEVNNSNIYDQLDSLFKGK